MSMKIVVIGGTGLIGSKVVEQLRSRGYEAVAAAPNTGVNTLTGEGLAEVLKNASVVVDVSNSPSFEEKAVMEFFLTSTRNLLSYGAKAGVGHYVALSVVGTDRLSESPYMRAKIAGEAYQGVRDSVFDRSRHAVSSNRHVLVEGYFATGSLKWKMAPCPSSDSTPMLPP